jgi:hypothetical protein
LVNFTYFFAHRLLGTTPNSHPEASMKVRMVFAAFLCFTVLSVVGNLAAQNYQSGKITKVEKQAAHASSGGSTDAPTDADVTSYLVSVQLGGKVYVCKYKAHADKDISWIEGKDVQARVSGKTMIVQKLNGKEEKGSIVRSSPVTTP